MPYKEGLLFKVMAAAYRHDVIDKYMAALGEALDGAMADSGLKMGDLVNMMDEAQERTVMRMDSLLGHAGPLLKVAASDVLMAAVSKILDVKAIRRAMVTVMRRGIARVAKAAPAAQTYGGA